MPALMCGADNNYLALTWRQIDTIRKAAEGLPAPTPETAASVVPKGLTPKNLSAQISYEAMGNPISSRPVTSVANCCPGLEVDFRAVWRRLFKGIELREYDNLVIKVSKDCDKVVKTTGGKLKPSKLAGHRLLRVVVPTETEGRQKEFLMMTPMWGPSSSDAEGKIRLTTSSNPDGMAAVEWSNALARILLLKGSFVRCDFSAEPSDQQMALVEESSDGPKNYVSFLCEVQAFFEDDTAVISADARRCRRAHARIMLALAKRLSRMLLLLLGFGSARLCQRRTRLERALYRRQLDAERALQLLCRRRLRRHAASDV